jgi:uncharacterized protein
MPEVTKYDPGTFCWNELTTSDASAAKTFYTGLFGWETDEIPMQDGPPYIMLRVNGHNIAAMYQNPQAPPHWMGYVSVDSADAAAEKAKSLGGAVIAGPFDVMDVGRMAVVKDPEGAMVSLWEPKRHIGSTLVGENGTFVWNELMTHDGDGARKFYAGLFGWNPKVSPEYTEWHDGEKARGGMLEMKDARFEGVPPNWLPYILVEDVDATAARARELGGAVHHEPTDIPNVGRFAVLGDPQGAGFAVFKPKM